MCVGSGTARNELFSRGAFLGAAAAAIAPIAAGATAVAEGADTGRYPLPLPALALSAGNARAAALARNSPLVAATYARVESLAASIADRALRDSVVGLLRDPRPQYARRAQTRDERAHVRDTLAQAGYVRPEAPVSGIFPPGTEIGAVTGIQPFWSAPGSGEGSHHAYPGGLAVHEYFNATMAEGFAQTYDGHYFEGKSTVDRDTVIACALYHDIMKVVVFQWRDDGTLLDELTIAETGAHHVLSGAEAIARGRTPQFVTTLLSAHAAPSLGDEAKVAAWARAAAIVAGVDPVVYGLLKSDGTLAADPVPLEAFISHLSDHDYVLSVHAMHVVASRLKARYTTLSPRFAGLPPGFAWYRSAILSRVSAIALYDTLARRGESAYTDTLRRIEVQLA